MFSENTILNITTEELTTMFSEVSIYDRPKIDKRKLTYRDLTLIKQIKIYVTGIIVIEYNQGIYVYNNAEIFFKK